MYNIMSVTHLHVKEDEFFKRCTYKCTFYVWSNGFTL